MSEYSNYRRPSNSGVGNFSTRQYFKDNLRVLRKNLVFCSGLPLQLRQDELKSHQYFGKYGKVTKVTLLKNVRQMSVYLTYSDPFQASLAIIATNDFQLDRDHRLASIYGTIKYCKYFLKKMQCKNLPNCNYLHVYDKKNQILINNQLPDQVFDQHYSIAMELLCEVNVKQTIKVKKLRQNNDTDDVLPCPVATLNSIMKDSRISECHEEFSQQDDHGSDVLDQSLQSGEKSSSEQETFETITQTIEQSDIKTQDFPKLSSQIDDRREKYKEKSKHNGRQNSTQINYQQKVTSPVKLSQGKPTASSKSASQSESLQIKLIRRLLRQPRSKLHQWAQLNNKKQQIQEVNFFHKELSELNQLREVCETNLLKEINKQEERVKFMLIKNIHHKKYHHHIHIDRHSVKSGHNIVL